MAHWVNSWGPEFGFPVPKLKTKNEAGCGGTSPVQGESQGLLASQLASGLVWDPVSKTRNAPAVHLWPPPVHLQVCISAHICTCAHIHACVCVHTHTQSRQFWKGRDFLISFFFFITKECAPNKLVNVYFRILSRALWCWSRPLLTRFKYERRRGVKQRESRATRGGAWLFWDLLYVRLLVNVLCSNPYLLQSER